MVSKQKILIVDDDNNIAELISLYLTKECFETMIVNDGESALTAVEAFDPNLILLDLMLPGIDGYQVCREVRTKHQTPIIMLSAKGEIFDKVLGLELGADDYIVKPFSPKELLARINALARRLNIVEKAVAVEEADGSQIVTGKFTILPEERKLLKNGVEIELTPIEFALVKYFMENPNKAIHRDEILNNVWGYNYVGDFKIVDVNIRRIRQKIEDDPSNPKYIEKVWGYGYRWWGGGE